MPGIGCEAAPHPRSRTSLALVRDLALSPRGRGRRPGFARRSTCQSPTNAHHRCCSTIREFGILER